MSAKGSGSSAEEKRERKNAAERARYAANIESERERARVRTKRWRVAHPDYQQPPRDAEQAREYAKKYRAERVDDEVFRARKKAADRASYAANIEQGRASRKAYAEANSGKRDARSKAWRLANPGRQRILAKAWEVANPERARALGRKGAANRRARKAAVFVEVVDPAVVFARDGGVCQICGEPIGDAKWHIDHRIPIARYGEHSYDNTQLAHAHCNLQKGSKLG